MVKQFHITNKLGLHARAAAKIVELARRYRSQLYIRKDDLEIDGSSILSILTLSCPWGTEIQVRIEGEDSDAFMSQLTQLFDAKFGEEA